MAHEMKIIQDELMSRLNVNAEFIEDDTLSIHLEEVNRLADQFSPAKILADTPQSSPSPRISTTKNK